MNLAANFNQLARVPVSCARSGRGNQKRKKKGNESLGRLLDQNYDVVSTQKNFDTEFPFPRKGDSFDEDEIKPQFFSSSTRFLLTYQMHKNSLGTCTNESTVVFV